MSKALWRIVLSFFCSGFLHAQLEVEVVDSKNKIQIEQAQAVTPDQDTGEGERSLSDSLGFLAGDQFFGQLMKVEAGKLTWRHAESESPLTFDMKNLESMHLAKSSDMMASENLIYLSNGDVLPGQILELNETEAVVSTWYAGEIKVLRSMIKSIRFGEKNDKLILARMPKNERQMKKDWKMTGNWNFENDTMISTQNGYLSRDMTETDKLAMSFVLARSGNSNAEIYLFADAEKGTSSPAYVFRFNQNYVNCYVKEEGGRSRYFGNLYYNDNGESVNELSVQIYADKQAHQFHLVVNGNPLQVVRPNKSSKRPKFNGLVIASSSNRTMKISKLLIKKWDGSLDLDLNSETNEDEETKADKVTFTNADMVSGKLLTILNGEASFKTDFATMTIPVDRMASLRFADTGLERARRQKMDVRGVIGDGSGGLTFELLNYKDGNLKVRSENFGEAIVTRKLFSDLQFNIYKKKE